MEIRELVLKHYGKFENHTIVLKPGINIIYGGNEAGKSTIHSFIRAMFFGLSKGRGKAAKYSEYQIRQPWDTPGAFMGSMRVEEQGEIYRIDRCFDRSTEPLQVVSETRAVRFDDPSIILDELLGGISEAAFTNTVFISQARSETDEALADELRRYMVNSDSGLDARLDIAGALQSLRKKKKQLEQKKKKEEEILEARIEKKQAKAETIRTELEFFKRQVPAVQSEREDISSDSEEKPESLMGLILKILFFVAGLLAFCGAFFMTEWNMKVFLGVFGVIFWILILPVHFLLKGEEDARDLPDEEWEEKQIRQTAEDPRLTGEIRRRQEEYQRLQKELEELYHSHVRLDGTDTEIAALNLAIDRICQLSSGIYEKSGGWLNQRASVILKELTGGRYTRIVLDETTEVKIHTPSRVLELYQVSQGTMQQIYFALRMAAGELLCQGKSLPVVLDETFAMYDDVRLEAALSWLKKSGRQVILFTCQKREREILDRLNHVQNG